MPIENISFSYSIQDALEAPWHLLRHDAQGDKIVRTQAIDNIEDAGRSENRVRHDYAGRYPLELLQNAHDACADADHNGCVRFAVTESALIVANEGVPFTAERVRSLVRLGSSEKAGGRAKRRTIGYKGIGFTSVFEITDCPQIISRTVAFEFDRHRARKEIQKELGIKPGDVPARGFPFQLDKEAWREDQDIVQTFLNAGAVTVIRLPFRANHTPEKIAKRIVETVTPEILLFMPYVKEIVIILPEQHEHWAIRPGRQIGQGKLFHIDCNPGARRSWLVASSSLRPSSNSISMLDDPLWSNVKSLDVAVAVPWLKGPYPAAGTRNLHVYFPTDDELGRALLIHGDFYIDSGRRHIEAQGAGGDISRSVATAAAKLAAGLAESIADQGGKELLECLAVTGQVSGYGHIMNELLDEAFRKARIVRPADGSLPRRAFELYRLSTGSPRQARELIKLLKPVKDLVRPEDDQGNATQLLEHLGTEILSIEEIAGRIDLATSGLAYAAGLRILLRWLDELDDWDIRLVRPVLAKRKVVQDAGGQWQLLSEVIICRTGSPVLPPRLRKTELTVPPGISTQKLVKTLGIKELTPGIALDIVINAIKEQKFGSKKIEAREILIFMHSAWERARSEVESRSKELGIIPVPVRSLRHPRTSWRRADHVYFPRKWTDSDVLENLYGHFGETEFLAINPRGKKFTKLNEMMLYKTLGVADRVRVYHHNGTDYVGQWHQSLAAYGLWKELDQVKKAFLCVDGHYQTSRQIILKVMDRLDKLLDSKDRKIYAALAEYLGNIDNPFGDDAEVFCMNSSHTKKRRNHTIGYQRWRLESVPWIPVRNDPSGANYRLPGEAWTGKNLPRWLLVPQARFKPETNRGLNLIRVDRPGINPIEGALHDLNQYFPDLSNVSSEVVKSAIWLLSRLDRGLLRHPSSRTAPQLPCIANGKYKWSSIPLIADLPEISELSGIEYLPAGRWQGIRHSYGLRCASEVIEQRPELGKQLRVPRLLSIDAKACLTAYLASQGEDDDRVATRLGRLQEVPVESIKIWLSIDGRHLPDPVARKYYFKIRRNRANRISGATLMLVYPINTTTRIDIARDLSTYLEIPDLHTTIALFLADADAVMESQHLSSTEIEEARRRVNSHSRNRQKQESEVDILDSYTGTIDFDPDQPNSGEETVFYADTYELPQKLSTQNSQKEFQNQLPPLNHDKVIVMDILVEHSTAAQKPGKNKSTAGGVAAGDGKKAVDWTQINRDRILYGHRGEEAVYESERRRLIEQGTDPGYVKWISRINEVSPYDIESIDDEGNIMYIEVKATTNTDPGEPFPISTSELNFAVTHRKNYFIYRVVNIKTSSPVIYPYPDPIGELESERGFIKMSQGLMKLPTPKK